MNSLQKTYITLGLLLVATTVALAQSTQPVLVLEYRGTEAKQPLEGVSLSANNAATVASDAYNGMPEGDQQWYSNFITDINALFI